MMKKCLCLVDRHRRARLYKLPISLLDFSKLLWHYVTSLDSRLYFAFVSTIEASRILKDPRLIRAVRYFVVIPFAFSPEVAEFFEEKIKIRKKYVINSAYPEVNKILFFRRGIASLPVRDQKFVAAEDLEGIEFSCEEELRKAIMNALKASYRQECDTDNKKLAEDLAFLLRAERIASTFFDSRLTFSEDSIHAESCITSREVYYVQTGCCHFTRTSCINFSVLPLEDFSFIYYHIYVKKRKTIIFEVRDTEEAKTLDIEILNEYLRYLETSTNLVDAVLRRGILD